MDEPLLQIEASIPPLSKRENSPRDRTDCCLRHQMNAWRTSRRKRHRARRKTVTMIAPPNSAVHTLHRYCEPNMFVSCRMYCPEPGQVTASGSQQDRGTGTNAVQETGVSRRRYFNEHCQPTLILGCELCERAGCKTFPVSINLSIVSSGADDLYVRATCVASDARKPNGVKPPLQ
ncbi:hypothetical protein HPB50_008795 [Hyalomma asiaticum]|uniref:Uncharacterized protein n=1 Tax=Hyalomma asiaticum TaxID=266040 RepID=A0ACB7TEZ7_HYAAI|nr:hypothetical protein HPB50_008795 [Hyalomma asiaticum]